MTFDDWHTWGGSKNNTLLIAGPCSAESPGQLTQVASHLYGMGIGIMRAGVWKPRTRPNSFEGKGVEALKWLQGLKQQIPIKIATEVATPQHAEAALAHQVDVLWLGARTTVNPFLVQEIANALQGADLPVLIKNPINPDLALWQGAIERMYNSGKKKVAAVHRGFSTYQKSKFRNIPSWQIAIELKSNFPSLPLICDPSHIAGKRQMILEVSQKALDLGYDGLMIEAHPQPGEALSDADQQVGLEALSQIIGQLRFAKKHSNDVVFISQLEQLREKIDQIDQELIEVLSIRKQLIEKIGDYKKENNVTVFQLERWNEILQSRTIWGKDKSLAGEFIQELYKTIHDESIRIQTGIMNKENENKKE
ncbi:MAG TPA: bifunctional 3-deoxy-7-phosphoheptulonate synthase/chorismate mutase type II [Cyclobacteriaceae bacterium]|nr:bifunctional 3-deoxy-7-phosphoheptulonate synthase/chorismate mutase type II [Cyclobacteriaceae bacterium]MCB9237192.1 bifunctional 3-deoxy-7-phosphoheptulonate synthase/chorismate mutase type II [Flammeovirgaceae bacterium]MCB0499990.1 bifunctional 3-deoxy-7-phosphoheptulonate synthase/chorismate mutase type II [Cyclobacteriaceae bacterium]MCO5270901.1 bifunctional 3-deoxy-7-phosphoheptulonate synthase/chorismate mutase type II [Cyclobacteriaceae bacterium]MCW5901813.1 bifunctional 3-deoxy-